MSRWYLKSYAVECRWAGKPEVDSGGPGGTLEAGFSTAGHMLDSPISRGFPRVANIYAYGRPAIRAESLSGSESGSPFFLP